MKKVVLISTGNELIYGNVQETNNFYISNKLFKTDFSIIFHITVGDKIDDLKYAIREAEKNADIVIMTGGLGPTDDDHTLNILKQMYNFDTVIYASGKAKMELFFKSIDRPVFEKDMKQVTIPQDSTIFDNDNGLASGFAYATGKTNIIAMPGVPTEMRPMFDNYVLPYLIKMYNAAEKEFCLFRTVLMGETEVNKLINEMNIDFLKIEWGITTQWGMNSITFLKKGDYQFPKDKITEEFRRIFDDRMLSTESRNIEIETFNLLKKHKKTIAIAESCSGGLISKRITDIPGSSKVFSGGVVSYSDSSKINLLAVKEKSLKEFGAVSNVVAEEMAKGVREKFYSDIGISVTGIAGPDGGTTEKPVGTVYFGFSTAEKIISFKTNFRSNRDRVRYYSAQYILDYVRIYLKTL